MTQIEATSEHNNQPSALAPQYGWPMADWRHMLRGLMPSARVIAFAQQFDWRLMPLDGEAHALWLRRIIETVESPDLKRSGPHREPDWERGWRQNLEEDNLIPHYFGKYPVVRWQGRLMRPADPMFEYSALATLQVWLADVYMRGASHLYEFGAGTGHNLKRLHAFLGERVPMTGLDWAVSSQQTIDRWAQGRVAARHFDMFNPRGEIEPGATVFTCAALEQLGGAFGPFLQYLIEQRPSLCVHIEPINEFLDPCEHLDWLSIRYAQRRGYLNGFFREIAMLSARGQTRLHLAVRTHVGSLFLDGYSVLVWSPA